MIPERVHGRLVRVGECDEWTGCTSKEGYGRVTHRLEEAPKKKTWYVHRLVWTLAVGPIPPGYQIHHICHNRRCARLEHLELVERGAHSKLHHPRRAACIRGHEFTEANTYVTPAGRRVCMTCKRARVREHNASLPIERRQARHKRSSEIRRRQNGWNAKPWWSAEELALLDELVAAGLTSPQIAERVGRSTKAVSLMRRRRQLRAA